MEYVVSRITRESRDPRTYNQPLPNVTPQEHITGKVSSYRVGYQDAVQATVSMTSTKSGQRALSELAAGNDKPYRKLADRKNPLR